MDLLEVKSGLNVKCKIADGHKTDPKFNINAELKPVIPVHNSFHGNLSCALAEERLRSAEEDKCYLTRNSDTKPGRLILSYKSSKVKKTKVKQGKHFLEVKNTKVRHLLVPKGIDKIQNFVSNIDESLHPLKPPTDLERKELVKDAKELTSCFAKFACFVCDCHFTAKKMFSKHLNVHKVIRCRKCQKYVAANSVVYHKKLCLQKGNNEKKQCTLCDYSTHFNLKRHMKVHQGRSYTCKMCPKRSKFFETEEKLQIHELQHNGQMISCKLCDKQFSQPKNLYSHLKNMHKDKDKEGQKEGFVNIGNVHKDANESDREKVGRKRTIYTCTWADCHKKSHDKKQLMKHILRHDAPKKGMKVYICEDCGKEFGQKYRVERHQATHHAKAEYVFFL